MEVDGTMLKQLEARNSAAFHYLEFEDMVNIEKHLSCCVQYENNYENSSSRYQNCLQNRLWKYILKDLNLEDKDISEMINEYEPAMYWLRHVRINLMEMLMIARKVGREDIAVIVQKWLEKGIYQRETHVKSLSKAHIQHLATCLEIQSGRWKDWRIFADYSGCSGERIGQIHSLAKNEMKVLVYMHDQHGDVDINFISDVGRKYNVRRQRMFEIEQTIRKIVYSYSVI